nr:hypothetical protein CFP56_10660 [Quercus suber]
MLQILELRPMIALRFTWDSSNFLFEFVVNFKYASVTVQIKCIKYKSPLNLEQCTFFSPNMHAPFTPSISPKQLSIQPTTIQDFFILSLLHYLITQGDGGRGVDDKSRISSGFAALGHWVMETSGLVIGSLGKV